MKKIVLAIALVLAIAFATALAEGRDSRLTGFHGKPTDPRAPGGFCGCPLPSEPSIRPTQGRSSPAPRLIP